MHGADAGLHGPRAHLVVDRDQQDGKRRLKAALTPRARLSEKARGEWSLVTMAWNIKRLHVLRVA